MSTPSTDKPISRPENFQYRLRSEVPLTYWVDAYFGRFSFPQPGQFMRDWLRNPPLIQELQDEKTIYESNDQRLQTFEHELNILENLTDLNSFKTLMQMKVSLEKIKKLAVSSEEKDNAIKLNNKLGELLSKKTLPAESKQLEICVNLFLDHSQLNEAQKEAARQFLAIQMHQGALIFNYIPIKAPLMPFGYNITKDSTLLIINPTETGFSVQHINHATQFLHVETLDNLSGVDQPAALTYTVDFTQDIPLIVVKNILSPPTGISELPDFYSWKTTHVIEKLSLTTAKKELLKQIHTKSNDLLQDPESDFGKIEQGILLKNFLFSMVEFIKTNEKNSMVLVNYFFEFLETERLDLSKFKEKIGDSFFNNISLGLFESDPKVLELHWENRLISNALEKEYLTSFYLEATTFSNMRKFIKDSFLSNPSALSTQQTRILILLLQHCANNKGFKKKSFFEELKAKGYDFMDLTRSEELERTKKPDVLTRLYNTYQTTMPDPIKNISSSALSGISYGVSSLVGYGSRALGYSATTREEKSTPVTFAPGLECLSAFDPDGQLLQDWLNFSAGREPLLDEKEILSPLNPSSLFDLEEEKVPVLTPLNPIIDTNSESSLPYTDSSNSGFTTIGTNASGDRLDTSYSPVRRNEPKEGDGREDSRRKGTGLGN